MSAAAPAELTRLAASVVLPGFVGTEVPAWLAQRLADGLAGVCLFGQNVAGAAQVRALTADLHAVRPGVLVASDEEGGTVSRLDADGSPWPAHASLGALDDLAATEEVGRLLGARARGCGVDLVLGPVLDVASEPDNPVIGERSFGADPTLVARHGAAFARGLAQAEVAACAKHFPGHGATRSDSHVSLPVVDVDEATYRRRDLHPFVEVAPLVPAVMTAHVVVRSLDDLPATLSARTLALLREEIGFTGVVVSDALDMRAISDEVGRADGAVRALAAGVDLLCVGNPVFPDPYDDEAAVDEVVEALVRAVVDGALPRTRLEEASRRVARLAERGAGAAASAVEPSEAEALARGTEHAVRAARVHGDVLLRDVAPGTAVVVRPELSYAAGRRPSVVEQLLASSGWQLCGETDAAAEGVDLVVVEGRSTVATETAVDAVLERSPDAVVVTLGPAHRVPPARRRVDLHGGGAAAAQAALAVLGLTDTTRAGAR